MLPVPHPRASVRNDRAHDLPSRRHLAARREVYGFRCSVNFDTGQVRWAQIDTTPGIEGGALPSNGRTLQSCQRAVEERLRRDGYRRIDFGSMNLDPRGDDVVGTVQGDRDSFDFRCRVERRDGDVRSVDLRRR